jgi:hypothetical protein
LVAGDDPALAQTIVSTLRGQGYAATVLGCTVERWG